MAQIIPFRGVLYLADQVKDMAQVVAPPYDVIDQDGQRALYARHPHNIIRLEFGFEEPGDDASHNKYTRAAACLHEWMRTGVLRRDPTPAIYPYTIEYRVPSSDPAPPTRVLKGFLATVRLEEFGTGHIYPHENTRAAAKEDRFRLLEQCRANFSPIFSLFSDPEQVVTRLVDKSLDADHPRVDFQDESGFRHRLWSISDAAVLRDLATLMQSKPLFIADGHHRYETALAYRRHRHSQARGASGGSQRPYDAVMMLFGCLEDPGLTVLPTHRVLRHRLPAATELRTRLEAVFAIEEWPRGKADAQDLRQKFLAALRSRGRTATLFGLALKGAPAYYLLTLRPEHAPSQSASPRDRLDVSILQDRIIAPLGMSKSDEEAMLYTKDDDEALDLVETGAAEGALLLNPTKVSEVRAVAAAGERMPHKSTYFFPKPLTGLVVNVFEEGKGQ